MKIAAIQLVLISGILCLSASAQTLVWSDEFEGTEINSDNWTHMIGNGCQYGNCGWGNNELEYYTDDPENSYVEDGYLHIVARRESHSGYSFTSARMNSQYKADFKYGRLEGRLKIPSGGGIWPAFWMMPTDSVYGGWASSGEIDIMESVNEATTTYGTIHYGGSWPNNTSSGGNYSIVGDFSNDFHVYRIDWTPERISWFVDDIFFYTVTSDTWYSSNAPDDPGAPFNQYFYFLLNVAVGGNWPGCTDPSCITASFPQEMVVDWIRVYEMSIPDVAITAPADGAHLAVGEVVVEADASATGGTIKRVEFYVDDALIGFDSTAPYTVSWNATDGCYTVKAVALDQTNNTATDSIYVKIASGCPGDPYHGEPVEIPGLIEAEDFDLGGEGEAYHDGDTGNSGGAYRPDSDVDIEACSLGGYNVGWIQSGEWLDYVVDVQTPGHYLIEIQVASESSGGTFHIEFEDVDVTGAISAPVTGGWQDWTPVTAEADLEAGVQGMRFVNAIGSSDYNLHCFEFTLDYAWGAGDIDRDGDVDLDDFELFAECISGPDEGAACDLTQFDRSDLDDDGDVDLADFREFQAVFGE